MAKTVSSSKRLSAEHENAPHRPKLHLCRARVATVSVPLFGELVVEVDCAALDSVGYSVFFLLRAPTQSVGYSCSAAAFAFPSPSSVDFNCSRVVELSGALLDLPRNRVYVCVRVCRRFVWCANFWHNSGASLAENYPK